MPTNAIKTIEKTDIKTILVLKNASENSYNFILLKKKELSR